VAALIVVAACARRADPPAGPATTPVSPPTFPPPTPPPGCADGWDCDQAERFAAAEAYLDRQAGRLGILVRDRVTGTTWSAGDIDGLYWAGSTPKLAMAIALRDEARAGRVTLDPADHRRIAAMLSVSDNRAADALWDSFGDSATWLERLRRTGLTLSGFVDGFPRRWGFVKSTPADLAALMAYVLERAHPTDRKYIVDAMRTVAAVQRWGAWGAGPSLRPGVKNGWSIERERGRDIWITATVGFVGPEERYVVAAMYHQPPRGGTIARGVHVLTDLVATVFGAPVPAPAVVPSDY
jgi:beta-lactamase class A